MDIYVCGGDYAEKLCELCESLSVAKNIKQKDLLTYTARMRPPLSGAQAGDELQTTPEWYWIQT